MKKSHYVTAYLAVVALLAVAPVYGEVGSIPGLSDSSAQLSSVVVATATDLPGPEPACFTQVSVSLSCSSSCIGDKTRYACTATGSGGYGAQWYLFTWSGASPTSGSNDNPNYAYSVLTPGGPCQDQVSVSLTDGCSYDSASRTISNYCDVNCKRLP